MAYFYPYLCDHIRQDKNCIINIYSFRYQWRKFTQTLSTCSDTKSRTVCTTLYIRFTVRPWLHKAIFTARVCMSFYCSYFKLIVFIRQIITNMANIGVPIKEGVSLNQVLEIVSISHSKVDERTGDEY
jgi:hypothetical protein